jgi:hypothetical protein
VAVLGLGLIGQLSVQLLRANGCRVLGFDPNEARVRLALELGAHAAASADLEAAAERFSDGEGLDAVIVAASTPSNAPLEQAGEISRLRGRVVVVGLVGMEVPRSLYYRKELDLRMSMSYGPGRYDPDFEERGFDYPIAHVRWSEQRNLQAVLDLMADERLRVERLVTHRYAIDLACDAYDLISRGTEPYLGVLLEYGADDAKPDRGERSLQLGAAPKARDTLGIGVIGAGGFAQSVLLPALKAAGGIEPIAIASAGGATACTRPSSSRRCAQASTCSRRSRSRCATRTSTRSRGRAKRDPATSWSASTGASHRRWPGSSSTSRAVANR